MTETRNLILKSIDILASNNANDYFNTTVTNSKGTIENNRYSYTWNINLRETFGDEFYNKYSRFSICISSWSMTNLSTTVFDPSNSLTRYWTQLSQIYLSGLNFNPLPYMNGASTTSALIGHGSYEYPTTPGVGRGNFAVSIVKPRSPIYYFTKPVAQDTAAIRVDIKTLFNNQQYQPPTSAQVFGHIIIGFEVIGIL
jgi:hypothetical protein